jgi:hypothetical protein
MKMALKSPPATSERKHQLSFALARGALDGPWIAFGALAVWLVLQLGHWGSFVYFHDAWRHNFPRLYSIARASGCGDLARWDGNVDRGWPVIIETISSATTNAFRLPTLILNGCLGLDVVPALFLYKAEILGMWLVLAASTYVLGRTLFRNRLAAAFAFVAVLFASLGLDDLHSDQDAVILFWLPWILLCAVRAHRNRTNSRGALYFNLSILFLCLQAFDHYPHFPLVIACVGGALYVLLFPRECAEFIRHQWRWLWPAVIPLLITGADAVIFRDSVAGYVPSQRGALNVDLSDNGESGWVQPTVLLTSFLPLGTLGGFDSFAHNMHLWLRAHGITNHNLFVFRPNSLIYTAGFIPTIFAIVFAIRPGMRRVRAWWLAFTAVIFAISVQETQISYAMFHLPFFDIFRTYSLFGLFPVFAVLVMSGYGVDAFLELRRVDRRRLLWRSVGVFAAGAALSLAVLVALTRYKPFNEAIEGQAAAGLAFDVAIALLGCVAIWFACRSPRARLGIVVLAATLIASQAVYTQQVYRLLGIPLADVLRNYKLDSVDSTKQGPELANAPNTYERRECVTFGQCYLSQRDTVSLRRDDQGTFLRNPSEPVFRENLLPVGTRALSGITHPVFWLSDRVEPFQTRPDLINTINAQADLNQFLASVVLIPQAELPPGGFPAAPEGSQARLLTLDRSRDQARLTYTSSGPSYLNAAINYKPEWTATVNGQPVPVLDSELGALMVPLPPGGGDIVLSYRSREMDFFFYSRYVLAVIGVAAAFAIIVGKVPVRAEP